jgi:hypothetical protein
MGGDCCCYCAGRGGTFGSDNGVDNEVQIPCEKWNGTGIGST